MEVTTVKRKIAFIATGGTIASVPTPEGLRPAFTEKEMLDLVPELSSIAEIEGHLIMNIDSSNMQPEDWPVIAKKTLEALASCDGAVIAHGTDTLAYTSSALTYMLTHLKKPVIITGSQRSIGEEESDAARNLIDSFKVAVSGQAGVFVVFGGKIIMGDRASKVKTESIDAFASINAAEVGFVESDIRWDKELLRRERARLEGIWQKLLKGEGQIDDSDQAKDAVIYDAIDPQVLLIKLYPGIEPDVLLYAKDRGYHAVLIEAFGMGGVCFREPRNLIPAIEELIAAGITVAVTTQVPFEGADLTRYEVGQRALKAGAISTGDMTREAVLVRLMMKNI